MNLHLKDRIQRSLTLCAACLWLCHAAPLPAKAQSPPPPLGWKFSAPLFILTGTEAADVPAAASEQGFPMLVRLHQDFFPFHQAQPDGRDLRFATPQGVELPHEIEQWDPAAGIASI